MAGEAQSLLVAAAAAGVHLPSALGRRGLEGEPAAGRRSMARSGEGAPPRAGAVFQRPGRGHSQAALREWLVVQRRSDKVTSTVDRKPGISVRQADVLGTMSIGT